MSSPSHGPVPGTGVADRSRSGVNSHLLTYLPASLAPSVTSVEMEQSHSSHSRSLHPNLKPTPKALCRPCPHIYAFSSCITKYSLFISSSPAYKGVFSPNLEGQTQKVNKNLGKKKQLSPPSAPHRFLQAFLTVIRVKSHLRIQEWACSDLHLAQL